MNKNVLYHNTNCSKSRETLALLRGKGIEFEIVDYLKSPPTVEELESVCTILNVGPISITRTKEKIFTELGLNTNDQRDNKEWLTILHNNPALIERPILIYNGKAAIGRPPENVLKII